MATVLDGKICAKTIEEELKSAIPSLGVVPKIALLLLGSNPDSKTYVKLKKNACIRVGIETEVNEVDQNVSSADLMALLQRLNGDDSIHGILLQLPLPEHLQAEEEKFLETIHPAKDIDGLHSEHFFHLGRKKKTADSAFPVLHIEPCTPAGCIELMTRNGILVTGKDVVVIGRGQLVGLPLALMLQQRDATVTACHSKTTGLADKVRLADIVIVATGQPELVKGEWIKEGAVVVDVGINYVDDATSKKGYKIVGDVEYDAAKERASAITPVPGGIGPMTIAMLLKNSVECAKFAHAKAKMQ